MAHETGTSYYQVNIEIIAYYRPSCYRSKNNYNVSCFTTIYVALMWRPNKELLIIQLSKVWHWDWCPKFGPTIYLNSSAYYNLDFDGLSFADDQIPECVFSYIILYKQSCATCIWQFECIFTCTCIFTLFSLCNGLLDVTDIVSVNRPGWLSMSFDWT